MSVALAIPCRSFIVIAADGKAMDFETGKARPPVDKVFELTNNSAVAITGAGLVDKLDSYMGGLVHIVREMNHADIDDIARRVREIVDRRDWAEYKDNKEVSHMEAVVVGYNSGAPKVYAIFDSREMVEVDYYVNGNWDGAIDYLVNNASKKPRENSSKTGNKVAISMLCKASKANPSEIGRPYLIWHVLPNGIRKLNVQDINKLDKRYNRI